ncbi:hypothetical protein ACOSQ3_028314 [Xanthoceras sorbifolium]
MKSLTTIMIIISSNNIQSREWQPMARAWVSAFPEGQTVTGSQVEVWLDSNFSSLPADLQYMPRTDIIDRLLYIQDVIKHLNQEKVANQVDPSARFQRTDQWIPIYSWLESLDQDEVVKSKDISYWLNENPQVKDQLCSRNSTYHLMHYIKKCLLKILKRREKKGLQLLGIRSDSRRSGSCKLYTDTQICTGHTYGSKQNSKRDINFLRASAIN